MNCKICESSQNLLFNHKVLSKYSVNYYHCPICGFVQTDNPTWLEEAYINPINSDDTGLISRNIDLRRKTAFLIKRNFAASNVYLDFAGGYGLFTRLMRDYGFNFFHSDPYTINLFAIEYENNHLEKFEAITCFEVFEHLENPIETIEKLLHQTSTIVFSTELISTPPPLPQLWYYYGFHHGQHISFYSLKTLQYISRKYGLKLYTNNFNYHILSKKKIKFFHIAMFLTKFRFIEKILFSLKGKKNNSFKPN